MPSCLTVLFLSSVFDFLVSAVLTGAVTASACRHDGSCALHGALGQTPERELHLKHVIVRTQTQSLVFTTVPSYDGGGSPVCSRDGSTRHSWPSNAVWRQHHSVYLVNFWYLDPWTTNITPFYVFCVSQMCCKASPYPCKRPWFSSSQSLPRLQKAESLWNSPSYWLRLLYGRHLVSTFMVVKFSSYSSAHILSAWAYLSSTWLTQLLALIYPQPGENVFLRLPVKTVQV